MAIDSAAKRQSACFFGLAGKPRIVLPDGSIDQGDRQTVIGFYRGILAGEGVLLSTLLLIQFMIDNRERGLKLDHREWSLGIDDIERGLM